MKKITIFILLAASLTSCGQPQDTPCNTATVCLSNTATVCLSITAAKRGCDTDQSGGLTPNEIILLHVDTVRYHMDNCKAKPFEASAWAAIERHRAGLVDTSAIAMYQAFPPRIECFEVGEFDN